MYFNYVICMQAPQFQLFYLTYQLALLKDQELQVLPMDNHQIPTQMSENSPQQRKSSSESSSH